MPFVEFEGEVRELVPGEVLVGSGTQAAWRVQSADLAARHFAIVVDGDGARLRPVSSQHIVAVNGRAVRAEAVPLADGDVISAGSARFLYLARADGTRPAGWDAQPRDAYLVDERERQAFPLDRRAVTIGRDTASRVVLRDPTVSRFHADVRREAGQYVLYSMGSSGTRVNGQRVAAPQVLEEGDRIEIGDASLVFTHEAPAGMPLVRGTDEEDEDAVSRRDTVLGQRAIEMDDALTRGPFRPSLAVAIGAAVVIVVTLAFVLLR